MDTTPQTNASSASSNTMQRLSPIDQQFIAKLEKLTELKAKGSLSESEFQEQKSVALSQWRPTLDKAELKAEGFIRKVAELVIISGILWISIAWFQMNSWWFVIAGVWNLGIGSYRLHTSVRIRARDAGIPDEHKGVWLLIATAVVNVLFGGIFGIVCAGFDFYIRSLILKHREIFNVEPQLQEAPKLRLENPMPSGEAEPAKF